MKETIVKAFDESIRVKQAFLRDNLEALTQAIEAIVAAFKSGNKLLLFGNGGSAADAQHIAAEFTNRFLIERPPLPAIALTTDSSALTAIANDYDYAQVFAKQVQALGKAGDVALAISTSGNSPNVLPAIEACKKLAMTTVGLTGGSGGKMVGKVDYMLRVSEGSKNHLGVGAAFGQEILKARLPHRKLSILATAARLGIPVTCHIAIGTDIIHMHPKVDGKALGDCSLRDFRTLTSVVATLGGGVYLNVGSAVVLPEVFLKAVSLARNLGNPVQNLTKVNLDFLQHYRPLTT